MLVIISDLHLTDGTSGETIRAGAFRAFRESLRELAWPVLSESRHQWQKLRNLPPA